MRAIELNDRRPVWPTMNLKTKVPTSWLMVACVLLFTGLSDAGTWRTFDGQVIQADAVEFDFSSKMVILENSQTKARANYSTRDLDFPSKRLLLFSPAFHQSFPDEGFFQKERLWLLGLAILSPVVLLITGMWLAGLFIARRFNPFSAIGAFLGSWVAGAILTICYFVFAQKSQMGNGLIYAGIIMSALIMALFISAMYRTTFMKGVFIFVAHLLFAGLLGYVVVYGADKLVPRDDVSAFWQQWVFVPTGLAEGPARIGY